MPRKPAMLVATALLALAGCGTVTDERRSSITVGIDTYELRTRTIEGPNGRYETTSAIVYGLPFLCKIDSPGDCEAAVRRGLERVPF